MQTECYNAWSATSCSLQPNDTHELKRLEGRELDRDEGWDEIWMKKTLSICSTDASNALRPVSLSLHGGLYTRLQNVGYKNKLNIHKYCVSIFWWRDGGGDWGDSSHLRCLGLLGSAARTSSQKRSQSSLARCFLRLEVLVVRCCEDAACCFSWLLLKSSALCKNGEKATISD